MDQDIFFNGEPSLQQETVGFVRQFEYPDPNGAGFENFVEQFKWPNQNVSDAFVNASAAESNSYSGFTRDLNARNSKDCEYLTSLMGRIDTELSRLGAARIAAKTKERKEIDENIAGVKRAKTQVESLISKNSCEKVLAQQQQEGLMKQIQQATGGKEDNTVRYMIFGGVALMVLITGIIVFRKLNAR